MDAFGFDHPDLQRVATPTGETCVGCGEAIGEVDEGFAMNYSEPCDDGVTVRTAAYHCECFLRSVLGSVGHQLGRCSCFGGHEEDPPGMTKREAARAAVALFERTHNMEVGPDDDD